MQTPRPYSFFLCLFGALGLARPSPAAHPASPDRTEQVLFAFDDRSLPFQQGLQLKLFSFGTGGRNVANRVLTLGPAGSPDSRGITFFGNVLEVKGELFMWYLGVGDHDHAFNPNQDLHLCFARSRDGIHWEKPALGLVEYGGNKNNNLVEIGQGTLPMVGNVIFYEPDDPDPSRRFKLVFEADKSEWGQASFGDLAVAFSPDGLKWTESPHNPVSQYIEPSGGIKWQGAYYVNGHGGGHWTPGQFKAFRYLITFVSYDFEHWTQASALGFRRDSLPPRPVVAFGGNDGEQVHMGAALWNRGNVIVGFYGQWHGSPTNDRRLVSMDLGLIVSHDALHFFEPIPDFPIVSAKETTMYLPYEVAPALMQGQGFVNRNGQTLFWYSAWDQLKDGVRLAHWEQDRLGCLQPWQEAEGLPWPFFVSAPISTGGNPVAISLNAAGFGAHGRLKVSILDEQFRPLPGFGEGDCTGPSQSGLRQSVTWGQRDRISSVHPFRIRVDFTGVRPEDLRLYAIYLTPSQ